MGHEDPFPRPRPNGRCRFGQETFGGVRDNGRDAPETDLHATAVIAQECEAIFLTRSPRRPLRGVIASLRSPGRSCYVPVRRDR